MAKRKRFRKPDYDPKVITAGWADDTTFNQLASELEGHEDPGRYEALAFGKLLEHTLHGDHIQPQSYAANEISAWETVHAFKSSPSSRNYLRQGINDLAAVILSQRPTGQVWARRPERDLVRAAENANVVLRYLDDRLGNDHLCWQAEKESLFYGSAAIYTTWDPTGGQSLRVVKTTSEGVPILDEEGDFTFETLGPEGSISWEVLPPSRFYWGGASDWRKMKWAVVKRNVTMLEAQELLVSSKINPNDVGLKESELCVEEFWHVPCARFPRGAYGCRIGSVWLEHGKFPYDHGRIPLSVLEWDRLPDSHYCTSPALDALPLQKLINFHENAKTNLVKAWSNTHMVALKSIAVEIQDGNRLIEVSNPSELQGAAYIDPPRPPDIVFQGQQDAISGLFDALGRSEILMGRQAPTSNTSGKQLAFLNELGQNKLAGHVISWERFIQEWKQQTLELVQQYWETERVVPFRTEDDLGWVALRGADIDGEIQIEPASNKAFMQSAASAAAAQQAGAMQQAGQPVSPQTAEAMETGLGESMSSADAKKRIGAQIRMLVQGQPVQLDPQIPPELAIEELATAAEMYPQFQQELANLRQQYEQAQQSPGGGPVA